MDKNWAFTRNLEINHTVKNLYWLKELSEELSPARKYHQWNKYKVEKNRKLKFVKYCKELQKGTILIYVFQEKDWKISVQKKGRKLTLLSKLTKEAKADQQIDPIKKEEKQWVELNLCIFVRWKDIL